MALVDDSLLAASYSRFPIFLNTVAHEFYDNMFLFLIEKEMNFLYLIGRCRSSSDAMHLQ